MGSECVFFSFSVSFLFFLFFLNREFSCSVILSRSTKKKAFYLNSFFLWDPFFFSSFFANVYDENWWALPLQKTSGYLF